MPIAWFFGHQAQRVDPTAYLVDALRRIDAHPAFEVESLTPRLRKERLAGNPLTSDVDRASRSPRAASGGSGG